MIIEIDIPNEDELAELTDCATTNNLTIEQYAGNIVSGWLKNRILETYTGHVKKMDSNNLKIIFGDHIKLKNKE